MQTTGSALNSSPRAWRLTCFLLMLLGCATTGNAQQPTAILTDFSGTVEISIQGKAPIAPTAGMTLRAGDSLQTQAGASVVLTFSEGSELRLGQNTKLDLATLAQRPQTGARQSRIKLWYGQLRAFLSPGHQKAGSSFDVETLNAVGGVKFSHPDFEAEYLPETKTSIFRWYTVGGTVVNTVTKERRGIPKAHQAIVQEEFLWITAIVQEIREIPPAEKQRQTYVNLLSQTEQIAAGTVSTVPMAFGGHAETSQSPGPGGAAAGPRPLTVIVTTSEE